MTHSRTALLLSSILLLVCASCIAPALAEVQKEVVVDGVNLIEFDTAPTKLNSQYYKMEPESDFVVDGTQNYWVRIGSVKASRLSKNDYAAIVCKGAIIIGAAGIAYAAAPAIAAGGGVTLTIGGISLTATANGITALVGGAIGFVADEMTSICTEFEKWAL